MQAWRKRAESSQKGSDSGLQFTALLLGRYGQLRYHDGNFHNCNFSMNYVWNLASHALLPPSNQGPLESGTWMCERFHLFFCANVIGS